MSIRKVDNMKYTKFLSLAVLALISVGCGSGSSGSPDSQGGGSSSDSAAQYSNNFMFYIAGSDLEEGYFKAASADLDEIIEGYYRLSTVQQKDFHALIGFGGSRATGWKGIKYADMDCLILDSKDGQYGNDTCYAYEDDNANMGSGATLEAFVNYAQNSMLQSRRNYFVFWNHGGAYNGVCYDSNKGGDRLTVNELDNAFKATNAHFDMMGMDACLMGNFEVIRGIKPYADYYLASEETIPGHGWDYRDVIYDIGSDATQGFPALGKKLVDSYINSPAHQYTQDKTLSFIDLSKIDALTNALDTVTQKLDGNSDFRAIGLSAYDAQKFGVTESHQDGYSIDIKAFVTTLKAQKKELEPEIVSLENALDDVVLYSQSQKYDSYGISIYQPLDYKDWSSYDNFYYVASQNWHVLLSSFTVTKGSDTTPPVIHSAESCSQNGQEGNCLVVDDNIALKSVESYGLMPFGQTDYILLYSELLTHTDRTYFLPKFSDAWLYLCDGGNDKCIFPSAIEMQSGEQDSRYYLSFGMYNQQDVTFILKLKREGTVSMIAIPNTDSTQSAKEQYTIKKGDTVRFDYIGFDINFDLEIFIGDELTFSQTPSWKTQSFNLEVAYFASAEDFNNNSSETDIYSNSTGSSGGGGSGQSIIPPIDTSSDQTRLNYLAGQTLHMNYRYPNSSGQYHDYNETLVLETDSYYSENFNEYVLKGVHATLDGNYDMYCFSENDLSKRVVIGGTRFMYDCVTYGDTFRDLFVFNIDTSDGSLHGYYVYTDASTNPYTEIQNRHEPLLNASLYTIVY